MLHLKKLINDLNCALVFTAVSTHSLCALKIVLLLSPRLQLHSRALTLSLIFLAVFAINLAAATPSFFCDISVTTPENLGRRSLLEGSVSPLSSITFCILGDELAIRPLTTLANDCGPFGICFLILAVMFHVVFCETGFSP